MQSFIQETFQGEFGLLSDKFSIRELPVSLASACAEQFVANPGVYVFWKAGQVVKVGRHLTNARKRALEHIRCNTGGCMAALLEDESAYITLLSLKDPSDRHWAAAVEIFLEQKLNPLVRSARLG